MSENTPAGPPDAEPDALQTLITDWNDWKAAAAVPAPGAGQQVPAELVTDGEIVKGVPGLLTLLSDGGWSDREMLEWLFTADDSLPGRPIDALRENRGSEVKRRAQVLAL